MTWTYDGDPAASDLSAVRWYVGDTDTTDQLATDEEIAFAVAEKPSTKLAAALVADAIAAQFSRDADRKVGDVSIQLSQRAEAFRKLADDLRADSASLALPAFGGLTISGKQELDADTDAVQPSFRIGQDDHPEIPSERTGTRDPLRGCS